MRRLGLLVVACSSMVIAGSAAAIVPAVDASSLSTTPIQLDDTSVGWVRSIAGGTEEAGGEITPITIEVGLAGGAEMMAWVDAFLSAQPRRKRRLVAFEPGATRRRAFGELTIAQVTFPALDERQPAPAFLDVTLVPTAIAQTTFGKSPPVPPTEDSQILWDAALFRFSLDGADLDVTRIEELSVKIADKAKQTGPLTIVAPGSSRAVWDAWAKAGGSDRHTIRVGLLAPDRQELAALVLEATTITAIVDVPAKPPKAAEIVVTIVPTSARFVCGACK